VDGVGGSASPEGDRVLWNWPAPSVEVAVSAANDLSFAGGTPAATVMPESRNTTRKAVSRLREQRLGEVTEATVPPGLA
jgi:hypothetical protein